MPGTFSPPPTREPLVSDPGMHVPWCMSGSLTRGCGETVPGIPGACATLNFSYLTRDPSDNSRGSGHYNPTTTGNRFAVILLIVMICFREIIIMIFQKHTYFKSTTIEMYDAKIDFMINIKIIWTENHDDVIAWKCFGYYCPLVRESTGWFPLQQASNSMTWFFFGVSSNQLLTKKISCWSFDTPCRSCDVFVKMHWDVLFEVIMTTQFQAMGRRHSVLTNITGASLRPENWGFASLLWRHNERDGVSMQQRLDCLFNRLFWRRSKKTSKLRVTGRCEGNSPVTGEFPSQRPVTRNFDVFFELRLNKRLSKQSWDWWCETLSRSLWRHRNDLWRQVCKFVYTYCFVHIPAKWNVGMSSIKIISLPGAYIINTN